MSDKTKIQIIVMVVVLLFIVITSLPKMLQPIISERAYFIIQLIVSAFELCCIWFGAGEIIKYILEHDNDK